MSRVLCPGAADACRAYMTDHKLTVRTFAAQARLSVAQVSRVRSSNGIMALDTYAALARVLPAGWTGDHCRLIDRPGGPPRRSKPTTAGERDYTTRRRYWPALDSFAGLPGGWC